MCLAKLLCGAAAWDTEYIPVCCMAPAFAAMHLLTVQWTQGAMGASVRMTGCQNGMLQSCQGRAQRTILHTIENQIPANQSAHSPHNMATFDDTSANAVRLRLCPSLSVPLAQHRQLQTSTFAGCMPAAYRVRRDEAGLHSLLLRNAGCCCIRGGVMPKQVKCASAGAGA